MATKVLFFGQDTRLCIPVLTSAGYHVAAHDSALHMHPSFFDDPETAAVAVSGSSKSFHDPISAVRKQTPVPFVLFALPGEQSGASIFDMVVPSARPSAQWLPEFGFLIRQCRETRTHARRVTATSDWLSKLTRATIAKSRQILESSRLERELSEGVRERSRRECERTTREMARSYAGSKRWDELLNSPDVTDSARESTGRVSCAARDRLNWSIIQAMASLTGLLYNLARKKLDEVADAQVAALESEGSSLVKNLESLLIQRKAHRAAHGC